MVSYLIVLFLPAPPPPGTPAQVQSRPRGLEEMKLLLGPEDRGLQCGLSTPALPSSYLHCLFLSLTLDLKISRGCRDQPPAPPHPFLGRTLGLMPPALTGALGGKSAPFSGCAWLGASPEAVSTRTQGLPETPESAAKPRGAAIPRSLPVWGGPAGVHTAGLPLTPSAGWNGSAWNLPPFCLCCPHTL